MNVRACRRVCFVQRVVPDYRAPFFRELAGRLNAAGIELKVIGGEPWPAEALTDALDEVAGGVRCPNRRWIGPAYSLQGVQAAVRGADLVILEQASAALHNYPILLRHRQRTAFFGHGAMLNAPRSRPVRDAWKRIWLRRVDWWFAYTDLTADIVRGAGFPAERITVVNNATDTRALRDARAQLTTDALRVRERELFGTERGAAHGGTAIFCGRLVPLKWIPFLLAAADRIRAHCSGFRLILVGDGPQRGRVDAFCAERDWAVATGALHGEALARTAALADIWLNPGMLGLAVLDAFALGLPVATTDNGIHSPEIRYLDDGRNGIQTRPEPDAYARAVARLLADRARLSTMAAAARESGQAHSVDDMAHRFAEGIEAALSNDRAER
jgi:L-malate glycosyltransferase